MDRSVSGRDQAWSNRTLLDSEFRRGVTTKAEVLSVFGAPNGIGGFGGFDAERRRLGVAMGPEEAWYYESVRSAVGSSAELHQRLLLVYFRGDLYVGYTWLDDVSKGSVQ